MKILIAADMEGITGVVYWDHVNTNHAEYQRFRRLMTADVNSAIRGAFAGGASDIVVSDGHAYGRNILIEELDPRGRLNSGTPAPFSMVQGVEQGIDAVMYVGYHARSGTPYAILDHTWSDERVGELRINGRPFGEIALNAAVCGHFDAPVIMISGDRAACAEAVEYLGPVETAVVKRASSRMAAELLPPEATAGLIAGAAERAARRFAAGDAPGPFQVACPVTLAIAFNQSDMADRAEMLPGSRRDGRIVEVTLADMPEAYRAMRALLALART